MANFYSEKAIDIGGFYKMGRKSVAKPKNMNMNVKFPEDDYRELQEIADQLGGMSLSSMMRVLTYSRLEEVRKTGDISKFLDR